MNPDPLPPDLLALEHELAACSNLDPRAELRSRVLATVEREWPSLRPTSDRAGFARFAAATAAATLLAINLSASVANDTDWRRKLPVTDSDVANVAAHIRALDPDASDRDVVRQTILLHTAAGFAPTPMLAPSVDDILSKKELN
jgi:hypothetical protein